MRHALLLSRLYNTPLCIEESKLDIISKNVTIILLEGQKPAPLTLMENVKVITQSPSKKANSMFLIQIHGSLVSKNGAGDSGITSYESISNEIKTSISEGAKIIGFSIASPGGEADGCFGLASFINSLPSRYGVKTVAFVDGNACSAAYVLASSCQEIFATESSTLGSIGAVAALFSDVKKNETDGIDYKIVRSRGEKALYNPHEAISEKIVTDITKRLEALDGLMIKTITSFRPNLSIKTIDKLNGKTVSANEALELGLIDKVIESFELALEDFLAVSVQKSASPLTPTRNKKMTLEEALQSNMELQAKLDVSEVNAKTSAMRAVLAERERTLTLLEQVKTFDLSSDIAIKHIKLGTDVEITLVMCETIKESLQKANVTPHNPTMNGSVTPQMNGDPSSAIKSLMAGFDSLLTEGNPYMMPKTK